MKPKAAQDLSPELKSALEPMMSEIESVSERICEYDQMLGRNGTETGRPFSLNTLINIGAGRGGRTPTIARIGGF